MIRVQASTREQQKTVGDKVIVLQVELAKNGAFSIYKYSARERDEIGKTFTEVLWLPYLLQHLSNMHTLK